MSVTTVEVRIEELIVDGLDLRRHERVALVAAVQSELGRLLATAGTTPHLPASRPERIGRDVALAVHGALVQGSPAPGAPAASGPSAPARRVRR
jgi:hypothetical protein